MYASTSQSIRTELEHLVKRGVVVYMLELCNAYVVMFEHAQCVVECSGSVGPCVVFCLNTCTVCMHMFSLYCDSTV